jgi:gluconokinase
MQLSPADAAFPDVIIVMGVAGSGKTVIGRLLAEALHAEFVDADDFHPPENVARMREGMPLDDAARGPWLDRLAGLIDTAIEKHRRMVLACSALRRSYRLRLGVGRPEVRLVHLEGDESLLRERLEQRTGHFMPASLLASQCALLERPTDDERPIRVDIAPPPATLLRHIITALG